DIIDRNGSGIPADVLTIRAESQILSGGNIPPFATFQAASGTSPLQAELCWLPPCVDIGLDPIPFMVQATDQNDCPAPNITRDTFYIRLLPASALPPVLNCVTVTGPTQVALSWAPLPPEQRPGFQSYFIERNDGSGWQTISIIPQADLDSYTDFTAVNAYQQPYCYRIRSTRRCPVLISSEPGNELCTLVTRAESLSEVQTRISWNAYGQGAFAYSLFVESGGSERLLAENIQDTTYLLEACSFQGRIRVAVTDPATGCTSYGSYTREVIHANDPPEAVELCRVNVEKGRIRLEWEPTAIPDFASYRIYRKGGRNTQYELIEQIDSAAQSNFTDGVDPATSAYCYLIEVVDQCGQAVASAEDCQVLLQAVQRDFQVEINWTPYLGWEQVLGYELWEVADTTFPRLLHTFGNMDRSFTDKEVLQSRGKYCYQLRAIESLNGCGVESWSNVSCVVFSPSIFIPNAFTPNGDGINDVFSIKGLFVNQYHLSIFNRWGERIFESRNVDEGWDGTNQQGLAVPEGVYIYRLLMQGFEGETLERGGSITLIR
ncbi:MAG: gliding motility-associated C-terminal domain-containing protein, partial [Bacteroidetes bacterium]